MRYTVDRIEENTAVCESEDLQTIVIPLCDLPQNVHEGSVLVFDDGVYFIDEAAEAERRKKLFDLQNSIFDE